MGAGRKPCLVWSFLVCDVRGIHLSGPGTRCRAYKRPETGQIVVHRTGHAAKSAQMNTPDGSIGFGLLTPPHGLDPGGTAGFEDHGGPKARSSSGTASGAARHESTFEGWRTATHARAAVRRPAQPRPGHDHRTAIGRGLDDRPSPTGPSVLAAGSFARVVHELAGNKQGNVSAVPGTKAPAVRRSIHVTWGGALGCALPSDG